MIINGYFIGFAGTSDREKSIKYQILAETLGEEIMKRGHRLVSGGCAGGLTQYCAQKAADSLSDTIEQQHRIISILPDDKIPGQKFTTIAQGNKFVCQGKTRPERRPFMASLIDSLITIEGGKGTGAEIESCLNVGTPVIPIWPTGGSSLECWNLIRSRFDDPSPPYCFYKSNFISKKIEDLDKLNLISNQQQIGKIAVDIAIELAKKKNKYRCTPIPITNNKVFIIMPFSKKFDEVYSSIMEIFTNSIYNLPAKYQCKRHDVLRSGKIDSSLSQCISEASLLIVDLTGNNPNVLYEYGMGIGLGKKTVLINQSPGESASDIANNIQIKYELSNLTELKENLVKAIMELYK
ncbi:MAG: hypothetical protein AB1422_08895 [bacterium]